MRSRKTSPRAAMALLLVLSSANCLADEPAVIESESERFRVEKVADGLQIPWAIAFLPEGDALVSERAAGRISRLDLETGVTSVPAGGPDDVFIKDNAGMLDVVLHPEYTRNRLVYYCYTAGDDQLNTMVVERASFDGDRFTNRERIFTALPWYHNSIVYGCRLAFQDAFLFVTMGDRWDLRHLSQSEGSHIGKVLRLHHDGRAPADNPWAGMRGAMPEVFSLGNRNPQGLVVHPETGDLWEHEHGRRAVTKSMSSKRDEITAGRSSLMDRSTPANRSVMD